MAKQVKEEVVVVSGFDYSQLEASVAERVRTAAENIRQKVKKTIEEIIEVGNELLKMKEALPHGQFGPWLRAEFGWTERTARNFMAVAEGFGAKSEMISDLTIQPTAAYLLAAPSVPEEARQTAIERAEGGEKITTVVAKEIVAEAKKKAVRGGKSSPPKSWPCAWETFLKSTRSAGTRRSLASWPASFGNSLTLWTDTSGAAGSRWRNDSIRRSCTGLNRHKPVMQRSHQARRWGS